MTTRGSRRVAVLGSTGSIGRQALEVASRERDRMRVLEGQLVAKDRHAFRRRAAMGAGRSDFIGHGRLEEVLLRVADQAAAAHEPCRRARVLHSDIYT